jgi:UDP-N-acetylmuramate--alanine ligase
MSALARVLMDLGHEVSGSDLQPSHLMLRLEALGARLYSGHRAQNVQGADFVVVSSAVPMDNVELKRARSLGIPVLHRADLLALLMKGKVSVAVTGCHGKTTTTSMVALVLERAGLDPTVMVGGELDDIGGNAKLGRGNYLVTEADESDGSFLKLAPTVAVVTNIDDDHLDHYGGDMAELTQAFRTFLESVPAEGAMVVCGDDPRLFEMARAMGKRAITYGVQSGRFRGSGVRRAGEGSEFTVEDQGKPLGRVSLGVPGVHNISNALAALAVGRFLGVEFPTIAEALGRYQGVHRRFETVAQAGGVRVVDDYAHHPTEIEATLEAAQGQVPGRVIVVFQPHRYSRTQLLAGSFGPSFRRADHLILLPVYPAGENPVPGVDSGLIARSIDASLGPRPVMAEPGEVPGLVAAWARPGDMVILMGAGNVYQLAPHVRKALDAGPKEGA